MKKYKTEQEAEAAADAFAKEKLDEGCWVRKGRGMYNDARAITYSYDGDLYVAPHELFEVEVDPVVKKDQNVWVSRDGRGPWFRRHATGTFEHTYINCYNNGCTSFTADHTEAWQYYRLTDPNNVENPPVYKLRSPEIRTLV
jgi:hypothetical protein